MLNTPTLVDLLSAVATTTPALSGLWVPAEVIIGVLLAFLVIESVIGLFNKEKDFTPEVHEI